MAKRHRAGAWWREIRPRCRAVAPASASALITYHQSRNLAKIHLYRFSVPGFRSSRPRSVIRSCRELLVVSASCQSRWVTWPVIGWFWSARPVVPRWRRLSPRRWLSGSEVAGGRGVRRATISPERPTCSDRYGKAARCRDRSGSHWTRTGLDLISLAQVCRSGYRVRSKWLRQARDRADSKPARWISDGEDVFLTWLGGPATAVHHPQERRLDPGHSIPFERCHEPPGGQRWYRDLGRVRLIQRDRLVGVSGSHLMIGNAHAHDHGRGGQRTATGFRVLAAALPRLRVVVIPPARCPRICRTAPCRPCWSALPGRPVSCRGWRLASQLSPARQGAPTPQDPATETVGKRITMLRHDRRDGVLG